VANYRSWLCQLHRAVSAQISYGNLFIDFKIKQGNTRFDFMAVYTFHTKQKNAQGRFFIKQMSAAR
ncbi:MAG: hypothetical protein IKT78_00230, partial [Ruminiclostridium sp.]|nr:hypothetical protein [Ruminiclostridium sp.]